MPTSPCDQPPIMSIDEQTATRRKLNFQGNQHIYLSTLLGQNRKEALSRFYDTSQFKELLTKAITSSGFRINGIRIYFASYLRMPDGFPGAAENNDQIPNGEDDRLTLIFAPTTNTGGPDDEEDTGDYFILNPSGNVKNLSEIDGNIPFRWIDYYEEKRKKLNTHLQINETKSMWYPVNSIMNLVAYMNCTNHGPILGVTAYFAAYSNTDNEIVIPPNNNSYTVKKQLTLVFLLQDSNKQDMYFVRLGGQNVDTGIPCPPAVCG